MMENDIVFNTKMTKEDWDLLADVELEHTKCITFKTPSGKECKYIPIDVLKKIRDEIGSWHKTELPTYVPNYDAWARCINVIDEYLEEVQDGD